MTKFKLHLGKINGAGEIGEVRALGQGESEGEVVAVV